MAHHLLEQKCMKFLTASILTALIFTAASSYAAVPTEYELGSSEPSVVEVQRVAMAYHNIEDDEVRKWKKKARLSALLPRFQVGYDRRLKNNVDVTISENVYVGSSGVTVGPDEGNYNQNANCDQNIQVRAVWYLNELIFNPDQLDISRESRSLIRERQVLMAEVNKHYYERKRIKGVIDVLESGKLVPLEGVRMSKKKKKKAATVQGIDMSHQLYLARVRFDEETAALDALTGGWFSQQLGR